MADLTRDTLQITLGFASDVGLQRKINEDSFTIFTPFPGEVNPSGFDAVLCVADGMGGEAAGEIASALATSRIREWFTSGAYLQWQGMAAPEADPIPGLLKHAIVRINREIYTQSRNNATLRGMGSTIVVALLKKDHLYLAHLGDSRGYRIRNNAIARLTVDHSWVERQVQEGLITAEEALHHPQRNIITKSLGVEDDVEPDITALQLMVGDQLLLCSDGLCGRVPDSVLLETVLAAEGPQDACTKLVEVANRLDGSDNITVVLARVGLKEQPEATHDTQPVIITPAQTTRLKFLTLAIGFMVGLLAALGFSYLAKLDFSGLSRIPNPRRDSLALYEHGLKALNTKDYSTASELFELVLHKYHSDSVYIEAYTYLNKVNSLVAESSRVVPASTQAIIPPAAPGGADSTAVPTPGAAGGETQDARATPVADSSQSPQIPSSPAPH